MTKALAAEALHNSVCGSVVLNYDNEIKNFSYLLEILDIFHCLEDCDYT